MSFRINVKNAKWFPLNTNTLSTYTLGTAMPLPGLREIDMTILAANGELYGDGALSNTEAQITGINIKIGINKIPLNARATMQGASVTTGIMRGNKDNKAPEGAFYCETEQTNGKKEQFWLLCCKAEPIGLSGKQREGNIQYSTDELNLRGIPRAKDGDIYQLGDTDDAELTSAISSTFAATPLGN